jgi:hypothetical protein
MFVSQENEKQLRTAVSRKAAKHAKENNGSMSRTSPCFRKRYSFLTPLRLCEKKVYQSEIAVHCPSLATERLNR